MYNGTPMTTFMTPRAPIAPAKYNGTCTASLPKKSPNKNPLLI